MDENSEKTDKEDEILQRWWLHMQQINEEKKDEEGDGDESGKSMN
jgi:L-rhamnose mutarotase